MPEWLNGTVSKTVQGDPVVGSNPTSSVIVFTDGACICNPGAGGFAFLMFKNNFKIIHSGYDLDTTNNKMEMLALICALKRIGFKENAEIFTDSSYVMNGYNSWMHNWSKKMWTNSSGEAVANYPMWQWLFNDFKKRIGTIKITWVKAHADNYYNNFVDSLAQAQARIAQKKKNKL